MHQFENIAGGEHDGSIPIPIKSKDNISKDDTYCESNL